MKKLNKNKIYVIDNFLSKEDQDNIQEHLIFDSSPKPFSFINTNYNNSFSDRILPELQFAYSSKEKNIILKNFELKTQLKISNIIRVKTNFTFREIESKKDYIYPPHIDNTTPHWVLIYYVNNSDGDTLIFNETLNSSSKEYFPSLSNLTIKRQITPKKGRAIIFWGNKFHAAKPCIKSPFRVIINHNFIL